jgi:phospholipase/carboxylesterase
MLGVIDGPRLPPARGGKPESLVVLLHGYGSNGDDLISLAPYWRDALPTTQFLAPNAPEGIPGYQGGFQWFDLASMSPQQVERGVRGAASSVDKFLDREIERYGIAPGRVALVGFSQGTMMSLHVGMRRTPQIGAIIGFSGALAAPESLKTEIKAKPPILLVHGDQDDRIPVGAMLQAGQAICEAGHGATWHISQGLPHSIGPDGVEMAGAFLGAAFKGQLNTISVGN